MKLSKKYTNKLTKGEFDRIALNVICQGLKGQKKVKFGYFANFSKKNGRTTLFFCIQLLRGDIDQLS